jgi:hypothetical protein
MENKGRDKALEGEVWVRALFSKPRPAFIQPTKPKAEPLAKPKQTVWKRLSLSGDKSRKLLSAMFGHSGAGCWL